MEIFSFYFYNFMYFFFLFFLYYYTLICLSSRRCRCNRRGVLDVVAIEVLLEIEVSEGLAFSNRKELAKRYIRLNLVLVLEIVGLEVLVHRLGDLRTAHLGAGRAGKEGEELL